ncbi:MAG: hypothetical protein ACOVO1_00900 [Chitinophagaceae bacterium]
MSKLFLKIGMVLCLFVSLFAKAQKSDSTVTIIFAGEKNKGGSYTSKKKKVDANNIIKVAPTGIFVGQVPIIYERKLTPSIGLQASIGLTSQNYIRTAFAKASQMSSSSSGYGTYPWSDVAPTSDYGEDIYSFERRKAEMGTMLSIEPKFYLDDDALDGSYIGFSYNSYKYKFTSPGAVYSSIAFNNVIYTGASKSEVEKITDYMIHYGHQNINGHFAIEYSTALGLRKVSGEKYGYTTYNSKLYDGMIPYTKTLFNYEFCIRVGYVF